MADFEKVYSIKFDTAKARSALKRMDNRLDKIEKTSVQIGKKFDKAVGGKATRAAGKLNNKLKLTNVQLSKMRGTLDKISRKAAIVAGAFVGLGGLAVRNTVALNKEMARTDTLLKGNTGRVYEFKKNVQDLAVVTGKATTDIAGGLFEVVSAFGESAENAEQLKTAVRAGVAGGASTLDAVKLLSAVTKGYGDTSAAAQKKASDLAFETVRMGQTTFPELAEAMGRVIPLAAAMNTSQSELFGTMATLTGVTGNTAEVSTQLASVYSAMLKPTGALEKIVKKLGFESAGAMMKEKGLRGTLIALNDAVDGNEGKLAKLLKRKEALVGALALLGGQSDEYKRKLDEMGGAVGATDRAYKKQTEGINKAGHEWEKTKQRLVVFSQRVGSMLLPVLDKLLNKYIAPLIKYIENLDDEAIDSAIAMAEWAVKIAIASKALSVLLGVVQGIGAMRTLITGINGVNAGLATSATRANAAGKAMTGFKVAGVLAAAAIGYEIGTMLNDIFLAPARKRRQRGQDEAMSASETARFRTSKIGSVAEQEKARARIIRDQKARRQKAGGFGEQDLAGGVLGALGLAESPAARKQRQLVEDAKAIQALDKGIEAARFEQQLSGRGRLGVTESMAAGSRQGSTVTVQGSQFTINATPGADPRELEQMGKRLIRHQVDNINRVTKNIPVTEQ
ncbi:MAG: phage tail tape measure protein [Planctomycetes bacterium]|nr:phage tail tape measure protein [Planctomycetota bacterium]